MIQKSGAVVIVLLLGYAIFTLVPANSDSVEANEIKVCLSRVHPDKITDRSTSRPGEREDEVYIVVSGQVKKPNGDIVEYNNRIPGDIWGIKKGHSRGEVALARFNHGKNEEVRLIISLMEQENKDLGFIADIVGAASRNFDDENGKRIGEAAAKYLREIGADRDELIGTVTLYYETSESAALTGQTFSSGSYAKDNGTKYRGPNTGEFRPGEDGSAGPHLKNFFLTGSDGRYDFEIAVERADGYR